MTKKSIHVLLVDDNLPFRETLREILFMLRPGWRVLEASNGLEALHLAETKLPGLVLLDFNMPVMSGYDVALTLQKQSETAKIPVVLMTSEDTDNPLIHRLSAVCTAVLYKPFPLRELERLINQVIDTEVIDNRLVPTLAASPVGSLTLEPA